LCEIPPTAVSKPFFSSYVVETSGYRQAIISLIRPLETTALENCRAGVIMLPNEKAIIDIKFPAYILGFYNSCNSQIVLNPYSYIN